MDFIANSKNLLETAGHNFSSSKIIPLLLEKLNLSFEPDLTKSFEFLIKKNGSILAKNGILDVNC